MSRNKIQRKVGLALSGGSTWGISHVGVLKALAENNIEVECIAGTSAGAIVAALHAFGVSVSQLIELSEKLEWRKVAKITYPKMGLASNKPISDLIADVIGEKNIEDALIPLRIVATNIDTLEMEVFSAGPVAERVRASTCIPIVFAPVEINGSLYVDGGLAENMPMTALKEMKPQITVCVNLLRFTPKRQKPKSVFDIADRSAVIMSRYKEKDLRSQADILIEPDLRKFSPARFSDSSNLLEEGYRAALSAMSQLEILLEKLENEKRLISKLRKVFKK